MTSRLSVHRARADENFKSAILSLQEVIPKELIARMGNVEFPDFKEMESVERKAGELDIALEQLIEVRTHLNQNKRRWKRVEALVIGWARASFPFTNLLVAVAKEGAAVCFSEYPF